MRKSGMEPYTFLSVVSRSDAGRRPKGEYCEGILRERDSAAENDQEGSDLQAKYPPYTLHRLMTKHDSIIIIIMRLPELAVPGQTLYAEISTY